MNFSFAKIHVYLRQMKIFKLLNYKEILKKLSPIVKNAPKQHLNHIFHLLDAFLYHIR